MPQKTLDLSVVIITRNEKENLPRCLASLPQGCEVILVDSESTDDTTAIAAAHGAKVFQKSFTDYASQKNYGIACASRGWILSLDADEELSASLSQKLVTIVNAPNPTTPPKYRLRRQLVFMGKTMRFGRTVDYPARFFRRGTAEFRGSIHESLQAISDARSSVGYICDGEIRHYSYANLHDYFTKFNRYTTLMAEDRAKKGKTVSMLSLSLRPFVVFPYRYFLRLGFLDGYPGFCWAFLASVYSFVKYAKLKELTSGKC